MDIDVKTFTKDDDDFLLTCIKINEFLQNENIIDKRKENYTQNNLKILDSIAVSIYLKNGNILGFSSIIHRDLFKNGCRILNRFYKSKCYRFAKTDIPLTKIMILDQIKVCKDLDFEYVFMSRESNTSGTPFKFYLNKLNLIGWKIEQDKYFVCNNGEKCKQYIAWMPLITDKKIQLKKVET